MKFQVGDELTLDNNLIYIVCDYFVLDNKEYLFLVNKDNKDLSLVRYENDILKTIDDDSEYSRVSEEFVKRNKGKVDEIMNND